MVERRDEEWIAAKLKAEANRHEPDLDRIRGRIRDAGIGSPARRSSWLLPAAAATFVVLTAGAITAVNSGQVLGSDDQVQVVGPARTATSSPAPSRPVKPADPPVITEVTESEPSSPEPPKPTSPSAKPDVTNAPSRPGVQAEVVAAQSGRAVKLPGGAIDWIAAGDGGVNQSVRRERGEQMISGPHVTGNPTSTKPDGPFAVSWTGGMPEQNRSGSRKWRTISGPAGGPETGFLLRVKPPERTGELVLYVGADDADAKLEIQVGQGKVNRSRLAAAADGNGYVITIEFRTSGAGDELEVKLLGGSGGTVSFAAAALT